MAAKKILFYSHDTFGLGHIRRVLSLGRHIAQRKDVSILIVSGSGIIHRMNIPKEIDYIKLPSVTKIGDDRYRSKHLRLGLKKVIRIREEILYNTAVTYKPDLFVVDNVPLGLKNEAQKTLAALKNGSPSCRIILTMRDILDDGEKIRKVWKNSAIYEKLNTYYDSILVFGLKHIYDIINEYKIPEPISSKFKFCGYINKGETFDSPEKIRNELNINGHRFILITAGGGGDGARLIETSLKAMDNFKEIPFKSLVVLGPDFPTARGKKIRSLYSRCKNILFRNFVTHLQDFINASDLVISMGGYNTVCEILSLKKRAIIVPRVHPRVEQLIRAKKLAGNGLFEYIHPERLDPYILRDRIKNNISNGGNFNSAIDLGGLRRSSEVFNEYLSS